MVFPNKKQSKLFIRISPPGPPRIGVEFVNGPKIFLFFWNLPRNNCSRPLSYHYFIIISFSPPVERNLCASVETNTSLWPNPQLAKVLMIRWAPPSWHQQLNGFKGLTSHSNFTEIIGVSFSVAAWGVAASPHRKGWFCSADPNFLVECL